jgi:release factor glutamine methyltransferase
VSETLAGRVRDAAARLRARLGDEQDAGLDAEILARHVLGWSRERWIGSSREAPPPGFIERFDDLVARRARLEPIAYITGTKEFWGLDLEVGPAVLIPRPCTETLVEQALEWIDRRSFRRIADVGTGSGAVAVSLAASRPTIEVFATDISSAALDVARRNAERHGVAGRVHLLQASLLEGVPSVDLVVSNPPYVSHRHRFLMTPDAWAYEPLEALFSAEDGMRTTRELLSQVAGRRPIPPLLLEFGVPEVQLRQDVEAAGLKLVGVVSDLEKFSRVAVIEA